MFHIRLYFRNKIMILRSVSVLEMNLLVWVKFMNFFLWCSKKITEKFNGPNKLLLVLGMRIGVHSDDCWSWEWGQVFTVTTAVFNWWSSKLLFSKWCKNLIWNSMWYLEIVEIQYNSYRNVISPWNLLYV